jgi:hypothetical protein
MDRCFDGFDGSGPIRPTFPVLAVGIVTSLFYGFFLFLHTTRWHPKFVFFTQVLLCYSCFSLVTFWLKAVINDTRCSQIPNSVSGHTFYNTFYFTMWMAQYLMSGKYKSTFHRLFFFSAEALHLINQAFSYLGGWHTPRQIIYGALVTVGASLLFLAFRHVHYIYSFIFLGSLMAAMIGVTHFAMPRPPSFGIYAPALLCYPFMVYALRHGGKDRIA